MSHVRRLTPLFLLLLYAPASAQQAPLIVKDSAKSYLVLSAPEATPVPAQQPPVPPVPTPLTIKGDTAIYLKSLPCTIIAPGDPTSSIFFWSWPITVTAVDQGSTLQVTAAPQGDSIVTVKIVTADWTNKKLTTTFGQVTVTLGSPVPVPPIPPVPPTDPLAALMQSAYASDPDPAKATMVVALSNVYAWGAQNCSSYATMGSLYNAMSAQGNVQMILPTNITKVQMVISSELLTALPNQTTSTFTPSVVATEFNRIAAILKTLPTSKRKGV